ncbi:hypothetical protein [Methylobacterium sp. 17Sr1-1]|uniref:hypothetical protein n=1 Tax=Methylobacterium sp. 17Sr1-1 TaxID=2202826 RepID=UPI000D6EFE3A|nr:hypothetical protein [Methylobacterium sp. 17Sr1-1]AWN54002.1 hypothetical protein DK412_22285 [Methylobacterium sp. 17Sr1-1]
MRSTAKTTRTAPLDDAREAGLLGERTERVTFDAPAALVQAAMRETGRPVHRVRSLTIGP